MSLSPDGERVALAAYEIAGRTNAVFVVDLDGREAVRITEWTPGIWSVGWSPTGEWIAYSVDNGSGLSLHLVSPDGDLTQDLTTPPERIRFADWSPDGDHLLVQRGPDTAADLWVMDLDGAFVAQVTHSPSWYGSISWAEPAA